MTKKLKKIPVFKNEDEEFKFWSTHDSTDYIDWSNAMKNVSFPNLKKTEWVTRLIILPKPIQAKLQKLAHKESLSAQILAEKILRDGLKRIAAR